MANTRHTGVIDRHPIGAGEGIWYAEGAIHHISSDPTVREARIASMLSDIASPSLQFMRPTEHFAWLGAKTTPAYSVDADLGWPHVANAPHREVRLSPLAIEGMTGKIEPTPYCTTSVFLPNPHIPHPFSGDATILYPSQPDMATLVTAATKPQEIVPYRHQQPCVVDAMYFVRPDQYIHRGADAAAILNAYQNVQPEATRAGGVFAFDRRLSAYSGSPVGTTPPWHLAGFTAFKTEKAASGVHIARRKRGRPVGSTSVTRQEFLNLLMWYVKQHNSAPSQRALVREIKERLDMDISIDTTKNYAIRWFGSWGDLCRYCVRLAAGTEPIYFPPLR